VDLLHFLDRRLTFVQRLYDSTVGPFEERKRQIVAGEPPYDYAGNPEDYDGDPPFLEEWQEADDSVMVLGHWCLSMVHASLQVYLRDSISPYGSYWWKPSALIALLGNIKKSDGNFQRYRLLFRDHLGVDWEKGPVAIADLEQLNLTRNDLTHAIDIMSFNVRRDENHAERFPSGLFTDDLWKGLDIERIRIDRAKLELAIKLVKDFCTWLDSIRCQYPEYIRAIEAGEPWPPRKK
jgi:hypothetical protein